MALIGKCRTRTGFRFTSYAQVLSLDVEAWATAQDVDVSRVGFDITPESGPADSRESWSRAYRFPNYSSNSPLPGVTGGGMAPLYCHGVTLDPAEWPTGWLQINPYIISDTGHSARKNLETIWVLNDADGVDRRGSGREVWVHFQNGDDNTGDGSQLNPFGSLEKGVEQARNNPFGDANDLSDMHAGGSVIFVEGTTSSLYVPLNLNFHTDREWLTVQAGPAGCTHANPSETQVGCAGVVGQTTRSRIKFVGLDLRGEIALRPQVGADCSMHGWLDRCELHNYHWDPAKRWSVMYRHDANSLLYIDAQQAGNTPGDKFLSCCHATGNGGLGVNFKDTMDCRLTDWTGIAIYQNQGSGGATNCLFEHQRYLNEDTWGWIHAIGNGNYSTSVPSSGTLRITAAVDLVNDEDGSRARFDRLTELVGTNYVLQLVGFGANDGLRSVLDAGENWVEVSVPGASVVTPAAGASVWTWATGAIYGTGGVPVSYNQLVHPDVFWLSTIQDSIFSNIAVKDNRGALGIFGSDGFKTRCVFHNISDGGFGAQSPIVGGGWDHCVLSHCSFSGAVFFSGGVTNSTIINNVWNQASGLPVDGEQGNTVNTNHTVLFSPEGPNGSNGPFWKYSTASEPYSFEPLTAMLGLCEFVLAQGYESDPNFELYSWPGAEIPTHGVKTNVGLNDWGAPENTLNTSASGSTTMSATLSLQVDLQTNGAGSTQMAGLLNSSTALSTWVVSGADGASVLDINSFVELATAAAGSTGAGGTLAVTLALATASAGTTAVGATLSTFEVDLQTAIVGQTFFTSTAFYIVSKAAANDRDIMKQRIHNTIRALLYEGPFYKCTVDAKSGSMTVHTTEKVVPRGIVLKELKSEYSLARRYKRSSNASEMTRWLWTAMCQFHTEVSCEAFEMSLLDGGIKIDPAVGLEGSQPLLARLVDSTYDHPPEQSSSNGTVVEFTFEILTQYLRR